MQREKIITNMFPTEDVATVTTTIMHASAQITYYHKIHNLNRRWWLL